MREIILLLLLPFVLIAQKSDHEITWKSNFLFESNGLNKNFINLKYIIVGSLEEKNIFYKKIKKNLPNDIFIDLMGKSLTGTSAYMNKCNLFIGNDSGLMHLSVASKLNTIALFGPTNDKIYGHYNLNSFVIRTKERYEDFNQNTIDASKSYMSSIEPKEVFDLIKRNKLL